MLIIDVAGDMLENKNIVVTGAGAGLGRAYAHEIAARGGAVVVNDVDADAAETVASEISDAGGRAIADRGSVASWPEARALIGRCVDGLGPIHGLVNNAGINYLGDPWEMEERPLRALVDANVLGTMFCGIHAMQAMVAQGTGGVVLNVTSGAFIGIPEHSAYAATKGAAIALTYGWALDAHAHGIRVNAVSPLARTAMSTLWTNRDAAHMVEPPPEAVAPLVAYLLSDRAARINGQVIRLDAHGLSFLRRPTFSEPIELPQRTVETVAAAIEQEMSDELPAVGFTPIDFGHADATWRH